MDQENITLLFQLTRTLQDSFVELKRAYEKKDYEKFEQYKNSMLDIQNKIALLVK